VELRPGDAGNNDRVIVQDLIKEIAQTPSFGDKAFRGARGSRFAKWFSVLWTTFVGFPVVLLSDVDRLSKQAQHALRRTMEKYVVVEKNRAGVSDGVRDWRGMCA
jgi:replication factor C subunit 3/5